MNIFIARLDYSLRNEELEGLFSDYGQVDSARVIMDRDTGRSKGFGFVEMPNDEEARAAIAGLDNFAVKGRNIVVKEAEERAAR